MLIVFFDELGLVLRYWVPNGQGVNRILYHRVMILLRDAVRRRRPVQWRARNWALLHDNAPAHNALLVQNYLAQHCVEVLLHPGYSPDLSPCDYWLFAKLKKMTGGHHYANIQQLMTAVDAALNAIPQAEWAAAMARYPVRLRKCIAANGTYFERD